MKMKESVMKMERINHYKGVKGKTKPLNVVEIIRYYSNDNNNNNNTGWNLNKDGKYSPKEMIMQNNVQIFDLVLESIAKMNDENLEDAMNMKSIHYRKSIKSTTKNI